MAKTHIRLWLITLMVTGLAWGQTNDRERYQSDVFSANESVANEIETSKWKSGNWFFNPSWRINQLGYNSNVFATEENQISDYSAEPGLGMTMYYRPNAQFIWKNEVFGSYAYYFDTESLRGFQYSGESRAYFLQKRFNLDLGARFTRNQQRLNSEIDARSFNRNATFDINSIVDLPGRGFLKTSAYYRSLTFDRDESNFDPQYSELERDEVSASLTYLVKVRPQFWPYFQGSVTKGFFESENNRRDNSTLSSVFLGMRNEFLRRTHFNLRVGATQLRFPNDASADTEKLDLRGFFTHKVTRRFSVDGTVQQMPVYSVFEAFSYYLSSRVSFAALYETLSQWGVGPIVTVGRNDYNLIADLPVQEREDDWLEGGLRIKFPSRLLKDTLLNITYYQRDSNIEGLSDDGIQIYTSISPNNF